MGKPAIVRIFETDSGTLSGGTWEASLPLANIRDADIAKVARSSGATTGATQFRIDFGTTLARYLGLLVLLGHNFSAAATVQFVLTASATDATSRIYDSGALPAWVAATVHGRGTGGGYAAENAAYAESWISPPEVRHKLTSVQQVGSGGARYLFVYIVDTGNAAGYVQLGRFLGGPVWQPEYGAAFPPQIRVVDPSLVARTRGGLRVAGNDTRYREMKLRFDALSENEAWAFLHEWQRLGTRHEVWVEMDHDDSAAIGGRRRMRCALADTAVIGKPLAARYDDA
jgi:hypothetical protein